MEADMNPVYAVLLAVSEEENSRLEGRTLLQKKLYFLSVLMQEDYQFRPHYYGPYSEKVADAVDSLVASGFLTENKEVFSTANVFGERKRYSYTITPDGLELFSFSKKKTQDFVKWQKALHKINSYDIAKDFNLLSIAAKMHYILSEDKQLKANNICDKAEELGWQINVEQINKVAEYLISLGLIVEVAAPKN
jgi:uncharacterized protein YwgA